MRLLLCLTLAVPFASAQIVVGPNVQVSQSQSRFPHTEVVLAADPNHAERLIACSMFQGPKKGINSAAYSSFDGGKTWIPGPVALEDFADDPTCAYGPDGAVYFINKTCTNYPRHGSVWDALFIRRSPDGGKTWDPVIPSILANDRPFMAIDNTHGPNRGRLYVAFQKQILAESATSMGNDPNSVARTATLATSLDGGKSFRYIYDRALLIPGHGAAPAAAATVVLSDGTVAVLHYHGVTDPPNPSKPAAGGLRPNPEWLQVFLSTNGGQTLEAALRVADIKTPFHLGNRNSVGVFGSMAAAPSTSSWKDRLFVVWPDVRSGRSQIMFTYSADRGQTWSPPKVIDDYREDVQKSSRPNGGPDNFMPTVAANKDGVVGVLWYDRRDNADNKGYYARFTASLDGGETWLPSVRASQAPNAVPDPMPADGSFSISGGDTAGLAAAANGVFHALWVDNRTGVQQVWTAPIMVSTQ